MIFRLIRHAAVAVSLSGLALSAFAAEAPPVAAPAPSSAKLDWFREARFGMFIHWGLYSVPAGEYKDPTTGKVSKNHGEWYLQSTKIPLSEYAKFVDAFDPEKFDADKWAQAAADAGVKYVCITSKHHDGFAMFPSKVTEGWNFSLTPMGKAGRDPLMELKIACEKRNIAFCLYHTVMDWHSTDYAQRLPNNDLPSAKQPADMDAFQSFLHASTAEVIQRYHPKMMWFDGFWESPWTLARGRVLEKHLRKMAPDMIINDRIGPTAASTSGLGKGERLGDYATPEQFIPKEPLPAGVTWETCMTMNDHWGYNKTDHHWKSPETLVRNLVDIASKGGNFLLNVGPTAEGEIPEASLDRLAAIGRWMKVNGESVYGTSASPFKGNFPWGVVTVKNGVIYAHVFKRPADGAITLPLQGAYSASLLAGGEAVNVTTSSAGLKLGLPETLPDPIDSVIVVRLVK